MELTILHQTFDLSQDGAGGGGIKKMLQDHISFIRPGYQLLLNTSRKMSESLFEGGQLPGISPVQPGPRLFIRKVLTGNRGDYRPADRIFFIGGLVMRQAFVMEQVIDAEQ